MAIFWRMKCPILEQHVDATRTARRSLGGQDHEVKYEAGKTGASKADVKSAVKSVGNSRKKVEDKLGKN